MLVFSTGPHKTRQWKASFQEVLLAGLAASAELAEGLNNLYSIKKRDRKLPLAICLAEASQIDSYAEAGHLPAGLLQELLPGPVTVVLARKEDCALAEQLNPGVTTIGKLQQIPGPLRVPLPWQ